MDVVITVLISLMILDSAFRKGRLKKNLVVIRSYRPRHFLTSIPVLAVILTAAIALCSLPYLDKNPILWFFSAVFGWGDGQGGGNLALSGLQWKWFAIPFFVILVLALPSLARWEEDDFRQGTRNWRHGVKRSIWFGLIHLIMLIPLGAALALSIGGLWFTHQYFKGGVERSTVYHSAYNTLVASLLTAAVLLS